MKQMELIENQAGGIDLIVEKNAGNTIRIQTGNQSEEFWTELFALADDALNKICEAKLITLIEAERPPLTIGD